MTDVAHSLNLTAGWYGNNCDCKDHCSDVECFAGDVNATLAFGFDSYKIDGCGAQRDIALWAQMFNLPCPKDSAPEGQQKLKLRVRQPLEEYRLERRRHELGETPVDVAIEVEPEVIALLLRGWNDLEPEAFQHSCHA